jgi:4-hydroxy-2-oxoheptanedioate aldolase
MVIMPMIDEPSDVQRMIKNMKYPPMGERSFGPMRAGELLGLGNEAYRVGANQGTICLAMIETRKVQCGATPTLLFVSTYSPRLSDKSPCAVGVDRQALNNLDAILAIEGCDGVFVGPADLSISLSNGSECNMDNQAVAEAKKKVVAAAKKAGKISGIYW